MSPILFSSFFAFLPLFFKNFVFFVSLWLKYLGDIQKKGQKKSKKVEKNILPFLGSCTLGIMLGDRPENMYS